MGPHISRGQMFLETIEIINIKSNTEVTATGDDIIKLSVQRPLDNFLGG